MSLNKIKCPNCDAEAEVNMGQLIIGDKLHWSASYNCNQCGYAIETDGSGKLPDDLREIILEQQAEWRLYIQGIGSDSASALKSIRKVFELTLADVTKMREQLPGYVAVGTKIEMEYLKQCLLEGHSEIIMRIEKMEP